MQISNRLKKIADRVKDESNVIDIGTDHAYVPIYLYVNKKIKKAIAADVSQGSCNKARLNIMSHGLDEYIKVIKSDGFANLDTSSYNTTVIAGMGGDLMANILDKGSEKVKNMNMLILQPQSEMFKVREMIHNLGFEIADEEFFVDENRYYNIIIAVKGSEKYDNDFEYHFGKILLEKSDKILKESIDKELIKYKKILEKLQQNNAENKQELKRKIEFLEDTINEYYM